MVASAPGPAPSALPSLPDAVLLDEDARVELGEDSGRPHRTALGVEVAVTPWSLLAADALRKDSIAAILDELDLEAAHEAASAPQDWESPLRRAIDNITGPVAEYGSRLGVPVRAVVPMLPTRRPPLASVLFNPPAPQRPAPSPPHAATGSPSIPPPPPPHITAWQELSPRELDRALADPAAQRILEPLLLHSTTHKALLALCGRLLQSDQTPPELRAWSQLRLDADHAGRFRGVGGMWRRWRVARKAGRRLIRHWVAPAKSDPTDAPPPRKGQP
jgi:hypothetical protein